MKAVDATTEELQMPKSMIGSFQGSPKRTRNRLSSTPLLILAAIVTVYIVWVYFMKATFIR